MSESDGAPRNEPLTLYTDWYLGLDIEEIERNCNTKLTDTISPPLKIISWNKKTVYVKNSVGLHFGIPFDRFMACLNYSQGCKTITTGTIHMPFFSEEILEVIPPVTPENAEDALYLQKHGLILWGI